jgi:hypothetical protein
MVGIMCFWNHIKRNIPLLLCKKIYLLLNYITLTFVSGLECFEGMCVDLFGSNIIVLNRRNY